MYLDIQLLSFLVMLYSYLINLCRSALPAFLFFFSSRRRHTRLTCDWSSDVCSSDLQARLDVERAAQAAAHVLVEQRTERRLRIESFARATPRIPARSGGDVRDLLRSEERRVGKECRSRWSAYHEKKKKKRQQT